MSRWHVVDVPYRLREFIGGDDKVLVIVCVLWAMGLERRRAKIGLLHRRHIFGREFFRWKFDCETDRIWDGRERFVGWRRSCLRKRVLSLLCALPAELCAMDPSNLRGCVKRHALDILLSQIHAGVRANLGERVPLVHTKLSHTNVNVESIVVFRVDLTLRKVVFHLFVCLLAAFNLRNEFASCFSEVADPARDKALPPKMFLSVRSIWSLSCADTKEHTNFAAWPLVAYGLVEDHRSWVVFARAFVQKHGLSYLDWFEGEGGCGRGSSGLPDGRTGTDSGFFA